jgi:hypothetical protein
MPEEQLVQDPALVEGADDPEAAAAAAAADKGPDVKALAAENAALKQQVQEKDEAVRFWHGEAKKTAAPAKGAPAAETEDDTDLLDLIGTKGAKGLDEHLAKRGYVKSSEVDKRVEERAGQFTREARLVEEFPDLADDTSEFFKDTAKEYGRLQQQGVPKGLAMEQAANNVELRRLREGGEPKPKAADPEAERQRRIKAQAGDKGRRAAAASETTDVLSAEDRQVMAGMKLTEKEFLDARKALKAGR